MVRVRHSNALVDREVFPDYAICDSGEGKVSTATGKS